MNSLTREVRAVQNVALGGTMIWRFVVGYTNASSTSEAPVLPLGFMVLPILFHEDTLEVLNSTNKNSGLHAFVDKFARSDKQRADLLLSIHSRVVAMRQLSWDSLRLAIDRRLVSLAFNKAEIVALSNAKPSGVPSSIRPFLDGSEKLGQWCSRLSLLEISSVLKVQL